jgi:hypothetical protein
MEKYLKERELWLPVSPELMASYKDGSHTTVWSNLSMNWLKIDEDCTLEWTKNGLRHRDGDRPACIGADGTLEWWKNGFIHRDGDKPAWIGADGTLWWYKNGLRHRDGDLPAEINADGTLEWYKNGLHHRIAGPAIIYSHNKQHEYWINGVYITKKVESWLKTRKYKYPFTPEQQVEFTLTFG